MAVEGAAQADSGKQSKWQRSKGKLAKVELDLRDAEHARILAEEHKCCSGDKRATTTH